MAGHERESALVQVRAPAKVNLALRIGPRGADGYHPLATVFHAVSLYDTVSVEPRPSGAGVAVSVEGRRAGVPVGPANLAARAARLLASATGRVPDVRLRIHKAIPVAGGMAGGSADAAATLVACDALWRTGCTTAELSELAARLGSDVPFAVLGGTALGTGRGDRLTPVPVTRTYDWVLATSPAGLATPAVYAELDRQRAGREPAVPDLPDELLSALDSGDPPALGAALGNDLEPAVLALRPALRRTLDVGRRAGALGSVVSGSGPTCAFLVRAAERERLAASLVAAGVCSEVLTATGPAAGARLLDPADPRG